MADEIDDILGDGGGDEVDSILGGAAPAASGIPGLSGRNAGPVARRAAALRPPGPRDLTDEEAGVMSGPRATNVTRVGPAGILPGESYSQAREAMSPAERPAADESFQNAVFMSSLIPAGTLGGLAGRATTGLVAPVAPRLAPIAAGAMEGGTVSKAMGGDFLPGMLLGAALPAADAGIDVVAKGAPARANARMQTNLGEDVPKSKAAKVQAAAGPEGKTLREVADRNPELKKALMVQATDKPAAALKTVRKTLDTKNEVLDGGFAKMQEHYADKPATAQASVPQILDDIDKALARNKGDLDKTGAIRRARDAIVREFGEDGVISPNELRGLKRSIGRVAFPPTEAASQKVKAQVARDLYAPLKRQLETLAKNTPGLDVKAFMNANDDVATLIPVEEALQYKVDRAAQGKKTLGERFMQAAHVAGLAGGAAVGATGHGGGAALATAAAVPAGLALKNLGGRALRNLDFRLATSPAAPSLRLVEPRLGSAPAAVAGADRDYARRVVDAIGGGMSLQDAVRAADGAM